MKAPVASEPAEKTAVSLFAHVVPALAPVESVVQLAVLVSQVPPGVAPPAPAVAAPSVSQYFTAALATVPSALKAAAARIADLRYLRLAETCSRLPRAAAL